QFRHEPRKMTLLHCGEIDQPNRTKVLGIAPDIPCIRRERALRSTPFDREVVEIARHHLTQPARNLIEHSVQPTPMSGPRTRKQPATHGRRHAATKRESGSRTLSEDGEKQKPLGEYPSWRRPVEPVPCLPQQ